jgi:hypothetical protein
VTQEAAMGNPAPVCLACSILKREVEHLRQTGTLALSCWYVDSMLHMVPEKLGQVLDRQLAGRHGETVLLFGDCCAHMVDLEAGAGVARTQGINCCEILLGTTGYHRLRREGAFFLLPEWALEWRRVFQHQLGLRGDCAREFMREMHTRLIYLDTGLVPVPHAALAEVAEYSGLPLEIMAIGLDTLAEAIRKAIERSARHG